VSFCERWAWRAASRYVGGHTPSAAFAVARQLAEFGVGASVDQFGELVDDAATAERAVADYLRLAEDFTTLPEST
jgi:proline dehydrogenase